MLLGRDPLTGLRDRRALVEDVPDIEFDARRDAATATAARSSCSSCATRIGARILEHAGLRDIAAWVLAHHERLGATV